MGTSIVAWTATFFLVAGLLTYVVMLYNELVRLRNDNDRAWANIDVLLKQRHDEIPNLVATVKGYMQHERQTDRKSTRLNSSHGYISYAVFCLQKQNDPYVAIP